MTTEPTTAAVEPTTAPPVGLQVIDIENAVKAIDHAAQEGAYKGWGTIQEVLEIRNRLVLFLQHAKAEIEAIQAAEAAVAAAAETDEPEAQAEGAAQ